MGFAAGQPVNAGLRFLLDRQAPSGAFRDFRTLAGEAESWTTAYVAVQLASLDTSGSVDRARALLRSTQGPDGGWSYGPGVPTDADSTAFGALAVGDPERMEAAAECLARHQRHDGGVATYADDGPIRAFTRVPASFSFDGWCSPHVSVTAAAGRVFEKLGAAFRAHAEAAWSYLVRTQCRDGAWRSYWWTSPQYPTFQAVALARALGVGTGAVERAAQWLVETQHADGSWRAPDGPAADAFCTALGISTLAVAGVAADSLQRGADHLCRLQHEDGGFPAEPILRIPRPDETEPSTVRSWRKGELGTGVLIADQHRLFTSATCLAAQRRATQT